VPPGLAFIIRREVQAATQLEAEKLSQSFRGQIKEALAVAAQEQSELLAKESCKWAEACASQMADVIAQEQKARELSLGRLEARCTEVESQPELHAVKLRQELAEVAQIACTKVSGEAESRLGACFLQLKEAHVTLQAILDRYAERWERAWREEADLRVAGDQEIREVRQQLEAAARAYEPRAAAVEESLQSLEQSSSNTASELRLLQETDNRLLMRLNDLHKELHMESDLRGGSSSQLSAGLEQLRSLVAQAVTVGRLGPADTDFLCSTVPLVQQTNLCSSQATIDAALTDAAAEVVMQTLESSTSIADTPGSLTRATSFASALTIPASFPSPSFFSGSLSGLGPSRGSPGALPPVAATVLNTVAVATMPGAPLVRGAWH